MVYARVLLIIVILAVVVWALYRLGKSAGWWGNTPAVTASGRPKLPTGGMVGQHPAGRPATERVPADGLPSQVWTAAFKHPTGEWLYTRENRMLRLTIVGNLASPKAVLYVERIESSTYTERIARRSATVQLFTFGQGQQPVLQSVPVKADGPPHFELGFAHDVVATEAITGLTPTDDMLRKLITDINYGQVIDDVH